MRRDDLKRIAAALAAAADVLRGYSPSTVAVETKGAGGPVTEADRAVNRLLFKMLPRDGEGWLSEETTDDHARLRWHRVWEVDPLDGTGEFLAGVPEWCVSIGLVEGGVPVAGGILNPITGETFLGSSETGVTLNGKPAGGRPVPDLKTALVLASRSEVKRGDWDHFRDVPFRVCPMGSVAYKLARVAAGLADATWTFFPKHEWDVAGGVALVRAAGGVVKTLEGLAPEFNRPQPRLDGLMAFSAESHPLFERLGKEWWRRARAPRA